MSLATKHIVYLLCLALLSALDGFLLTALESPLKAFFFLVTLHPILVAVILVHIKAAKIAIFVHS